MEDWPQISKLIPGYDPFALAGDCWFDEKAANDVVDFFRLCVKHVKGEKAHRPFELENWQKAIIGSLFGWKRPDGTRRYREAFIYVPRKNGKTTLAAGIILYVMFTDHEPGAEIYSAAGEKEQATLIFTQCEGMIHSEPEFEKRVRIYTALKSIVYDAERTTYKAISADAKTKHGFNTQLAIIDELHVQPNRDLVDVLETSMGARRQPLLIHITTADFVRKSICNEKYHYAQQVRDGIIKNRAFLPVIYEANKDDDWKDPKVWAKANPNLGISISVEDIAAACEKAIQAPTFENTFKRLHLNMQTEQDVRWLAIDSWDACDERIGPEDLLGKDCFGGLDLSSNTDLTAFVLVFPLEGKYVALPYFFVPGDNAHKRELHDKVPYLTWGRDNFIKLTPGNVVDYAILRRDIRDLCSKYKVNKIAFDRWGFEAVRQQFIEDGMPEDKFVAMGQGFASMSAPTKELEKLVLAKQLIHNGHPVLRWCASNVTVQQDPAGNIKPNKAKSGDRIDGIVALIMAIGAATTTPTDKPSIYETRGALVF